MVGNRSTLETVLRDRKYLPIMQECFFYRSIPKLRDEAAANFAWPLNLFVAPVGKRILC